MNYTTYIHVDLYNLIWTCIKEFPEVANQSYQEWHDAILEYIDEMRIEPEHSYYMRRPDDYQPQFWVNPYLETIFEEYFPDNKAIYLDS